MEGEDKETKEGKDTKGKIWLFLNEMATPPFFTEKVYYAWLFVV